MQAGVRWLSEQTRRGKIQLSEFACPEYCTVWAISRQLHLPTKGKLS